MRSKSFQPKFGADYDQTCAIVKHAIIRAFSTVAAQKNLHVKQVYIKAAFLHGDHKEDTYMVQP